MNPDDLPNAGPVRLAGLAGIAMIASTLTAIAVIFALGARMRWRARSMESADIEVEQLPIQPTVSTTISREMPHHFTEDLVVPGMTYTGADVTQQDNQAGRSPEGV